ncbi:MAG: hypothetical protein J7513_02585, partial [Solirubrobacteraceae bacterium]|nr:hypothetical protein [Solirubrobacteraceae bacterium]
MSIRSSPRHATASHRGAGGRLRRTASRIVALAAAAMALGLLPGVARAGDYDVFWCAAPGGANIGASPVFAHSNNMDYVHFGSSCGAPGGTIEIGSGDLGRNGGMQVLAFFTVNDFYGLEIAGVEFDRSAVVRDAGEYAATAQYAFSSSSFGTSNPTLHEQCAYYTGCRGVDGRVSFETSGAKTLIWEVGCGGDSWGSCAGASPDRVTLHIRSLRVTLRDKSDPAVVGTPTGTALSPGAHRGVESAKVSVSDGYGSGIFDVVATIDGRAAGRLTNTGPACYDAGFSARRDFVAAIPCNAGLTGELPVDTRVVADGEHELRIVASDASGNTTVLNATKFTVDNVPPPTNVAVPKITSAAPLSSLRPGTR